MTLADVSRESRFQRTSGDCSADFTSYLLTILPLGACAVSFCLFCAQILNRYTRYPQNDGYSHIRSPRDNHTLPEYQDEEGENTETAPLQRTTTTESVVSRPHAETSLVVLEVLCLLGLVAVSLAILISGIWGHHSDRAAAASLAAWSYIALLACWRLVSTQMNWNLTPWVWNHTAALYAIQWAFTTVLFRSALIHPISLLSRNLAIARFSLASILILIAITTRRGNRDILLLYEDGTEPSPEPLASIASFLTFTWLDSLILKGYRRPLEIGDVYDVLPEEIASALIDKFRTVRRSWRLALRLIRFFSPELLEQQLWAFFSSFLIFVPSLLLKSVLEYVEDPNLTSSATAWLYVILLPIVLMANGTAEGQALWKGRKICIKLRAIMVSEIYAKTLRRKATSSGDTDMNDDDKRESSGAAKVSWWDWVLGRKRSVKDFKGKDSVPEATDKKDSGSDTQVNSGTIINLMSIDSFKVAEISAYWHFLIPMVPVQLALAVGLLFRILGWSALAGLCIMLLVLPVNFYISQQFSKAYKKIMSATDARIHATNEILSNVRIIKYFAWEQRFSSEIHGKREVELSAIWRRYVLWTLAASLWYAVPVMITGFTFLLYTVVEEKPLYPSVAFTSLSLFNLLRYPLDKLADMIAHVLESKASVDRVEKFLNEDETAKYDQLSPLAQSSESRYLGFKQANFTWGPDRTDEPTEHQAFRLINMDISFHVGGLNVVAGPTGSGKTSLLMALLGEMTLQSGSVHLPGGYDRMSLEPDDDGLTESVAYCAQQAWLVNDTIKQNIIFAAPHDEQRYRNVLEACALYRDLEVLPDGDATLVGEKGIVVSGGQKQRISLARALYSNARHVLLDDCLSAVDSHTAQHLFDRCITGPLMFGRTCILVTHNIALCVPHAHHVVAIRNGKIAAQGTPDTVLSSGALGDEKQVSRPQSKGVSTCGSSSPNLTDSSSTQVDVNGHVNGDAKGDANGHAEGGVSKKGPAGDVKDANARTEGKAEGSVDWQVIKMYLSAMGPWYFWVFMALIFTLDNASNVATNVWIRQWANSFERPVSQSIGIAMHHSTSSAPSSLLPWLAPVKRLYGHASKTSIGALTTAAPNVDNGYYLGVYALLAIVYICIALSRLSIQFRGSLRAARKIHAMLLEAVLRAKFRFFDTTPLGQITNRFSKDLQAIDQDIVVVAASMLQSLYGLVSIVVLISVITPGFLIAGIFLTAIYMAVGRFYINSSRDLKRLESVQRSPLYQQFGETLSGVVTIRAYGDERRFIEDNAQRINKHNRPFIFLWAANRWLALRVDFAGAFVTFFAAVFIMINMGKIDAGAAGLSLTYALGFNENILWLVRLYAELEQNMNHVERVKTFLEVEQEAPQRIPETQPSHDWPSKGAVEFEHYFTRYRPDLEPVLRDLTLKISAGEKVGIVGRTGAGKSSLAMALFRGLEADGGRIWIDDIDIGTIGLDDLRHNLTIVPQDPTLFTGTIRSNLDPFGLFTDDEIFAVLQQVNLIDGKGESAPMASAPVDVSQSRVDDAVETAIAENTDQLAGTPEARGAHPFLSHHANIPPPPTSPPASPEQVMPDLRLINSHSSSRPLDDAPQQTDIQPLNSDLQRTNTNTADNANAFTDLTSLVAESGNNLSQGQRQLLCLARALLAAPRVLVMDEATASIDYATDARIQAALRALHGRTLITVAHRLRTVIDYDKILVLDRGQVAELGPPWELIAQEGGMFRAMCETSGEFDALAEGARVAESKKKLIDFSGMDTVQTSSTS